MKNDFSEPRNLQDRAWDLLMDLYLQSETDAHLKRMEKDLENPEFQREADAFFARHQLEHWKILKHHARKHRIRRFFTHTLPITAKVAGLVLIAATLTGCVTVAVSPTVRQNLAELLIDVTPVYTSLQISPNEDAYIEAPEGWMGQYYPSIIPEGLVLRSIDSDSTSIHSVTFSLPENNVWKFVYEEICDGTLNIDSENTMVSPLVVMGHEATMLIKDDKICIYWFDGELLHLMRVRNCSAEEAIMYVNGLRIIK